MADGPDVNGRDRIIVECVRAGVEVVGLLLAYLRVRKHVRRRRAARAARAGSGRADDVGGAHLQAGSATVTPSVLASGGARGARPNGNGRGASGA